MPCLPDSGLSFWNTISLPSSLHFILIIIIIIFSEAFYDVEVHYSTLFMSLAWFISYHPVIIDLPLCLLH